MWLSVSVLFTVYIETVAMGTCFHSPASVCTCVCVHARVAPHPENGQPLFFTGFILLYWHLVAVVVVSKGDGGAHGCSEAFRTFCSTAIVNVPDCVLKCIIITITVIISHRGFNDFFFF